MDLSRYSEAQIQAMKAAQKQKFNPQTTLGLTFTKPFSEFHFDGFDFVAGLYNQFDSHGTLPFAGPLTDQPNKIIEAFNVIKALTIEAENKAQAKQQKQQALPGRKR